MRRDEELLGIPHKEFPLNPEEEKERYRRVSLQIESFYSEQGTGIETFSDEDLKKYLNNVTANLSYISDMEPYLDKEGDKRKLVEKTISLVVHLRKKAIAELIRTGLR